MQLLCFARVVLIVVAAVEAERSLEGEFGMTPAQKDDPDIPLIAYLAWCAKQPTSWELTWAAFTRELAVAA